MDASLTMQLSEVIEKLKKEYPKIKFKIGDNQKLIKLFIKHIRSLKDAAQKRV